MNIGKIAILDGYTSTMGEFNWDALKTLGEVEAYDRTPKDKIIEALPAQSPFSQIRFRCSRSKLTPYPT